MLIEIIDTYTVNDAKGLHLDEAILRRKWWWWRM